MPFDGTEYQPNTALRVVDRMIDLIKDERSWVRSRMKVRLAHGFGYCLVGALRQALEDCCAPYELAVIRRIVRTRLNTVILARFPDRFSNFIMFFGVFPNGIITTFNDRTEYASVREVLAETRAQLQNQRSTSTLAAS